MKSFYRIPSGIGLRKYAYDMQQQQMQTPKQPGFNEFMDDYMNMHKQRMMYNMMDRAFYHNLPQQQGRANTQPQQQPQQVQQPQQQRLPKVGPREAAFGTAGLMGINRMGQEAGIQLGGFLDNLQDASKSSQPGHLRTTPLPGVVY